MSSHCLRTIFGYPPTGNSFHSSIAETGSGGETTQVLSTIAFPSLSKMCPAGVRFFSTRRQPRGQAAVYPAPLHTTSHFSPKQRTRFSPISRSFHSVMSQLSYQRCDTLGHSSTCLRPNGSRRGDVPNLHYN